MTHPDTRYFLRCNGTPMTKITSLIEPLPMMPSLTLATTVFATRSTARHMLSVTRRKLRSIRSSIIAETAQFKAAFGEAASIDPAAITIVTLPATDRGCQACERLGIPFERDRASLVTGKQPRKRKKK